MLRTTESGVGQSVVWDKGCCWTKGGVGHRVFSRLCRACGTRSALAEHMEPLCKACGTRNAVGEHVELLRKACGGNAYEGILANRIKTRGRLWNPLEPHRTVYNSPQSRQHSNPDKLSKLPCKASGNFNEIPEAEDRHCEPAVNRQPGYRWE